MAKTQKTKVEDIRQLDDSALAAKIGEENFRLKKSQFSHAINPIENPSQIRDIRRQIARLKTEQRRRVLASK